MASTTQPQNGGGAHVADEKAFEIAGVGEKPVKAQYGSFLETPEVTGGDAGNQISDTGNETIVKDEDSGEITNGVHAQEKGMTRGQARNVNQMSEAPAGNDFDLVARTGSTMLPSQEKFEGLDGSNRQHHLLRHSLSPEERGTAVLSHFGVDTVADAAKQIKKMSQRDLQARFKAVYGTKTFSNNNNWLRRKLFEAIGMDPGKSSTKKATQTGPRRRRAGVALKATSVTATRRTKPPLRYARRSKADLEEEQNHVAEALLALAEFGSEEDTKTEKIMDRIPHDGMVPGRDDSSEAGLSWSSRGRDVPTMHHQDVIKQEPVIASKLPTAPPLVTDQTQETMMASMMEYFSMMQRLMMQSPENQHMLMQMMSGQQPNPSQQSQMLHKMHQMQQMQQMQMLMALQANPAMMSAFTTASQSHQESMQTPFFNNGMVHNDGAYPDLFMGRSDS